MITKITDINKYSSLFKRAWDELKNRNVFTAAELAYYEGLGNTFTCLEDYFTRIHTLIDVENPNYEYIMLPIDEPVFEINANTREITIPAGFKKLVSVQGDHIAETLIFSIDRFFDFVDLLNTQIYIQWIDENDADRATPVDMIHYDASTGKILFGWPISTEVTKKARNINFSVRFFIKEPGAQGKIQYSFNTKIHQISIAPALQPDLNADIRIEDTENYFTNAIVNSPSTNTPPAAVPSFEAPGLNLPASVEVTSAAYELKVQAVASDAGYIDYVRWYHVTEDGTDDEVLIGSEKYESVTTPINDGKTVYYTSPSDGVYVPYTGEITAETTGLYERYYIYTIPAATGDPETDITGGYKAQVVNRTGGNVSKTVSSNTCYIYGPGSSSDIKYTTDLPDALFLSGGVCSLPVVLDIPDKTGKTNITYVWKSSEESDSSLTTDSELGTAATATATTPGWYQVVSTASRNRKSIDTNSNICKVTNYPVKPTITSPAEDAVINGSALNEYTLTITTASYSTPSALYSDELIYTWQGQKADDDEYVTITDALRDTYRISEDSLLNTNTLIVYGVDGDDLNKAISYKCIVTNKLNGTTKTGAAEDAPEASEISHAFIIK